MENKLPINDGKLYCSNMFVSYALSGIENLTGTEQLNQILELATLNQYIGQRPPENLSNAVNFAQFTAVLVALENQYGIRGGQAIAERIGWSIFKAMWKLANSGMGEPVPFDSIPLDYKLKAILEAIPRISGNLSDQISNIYDKADHWLFTLERCPYCYGRKSDRPVCHVARGTLLKSLSWATGAKFATRWESKGRVFRVNIVACMARGDSMGRLVIYKEPIG